MDQRDQELLDKQVRRLNPPRHDGIIALAAVGVFFAGMTLGGVLFANQNERMLIASNDATPAISLPNGALPTTR